MPVMLVGEEDYDQWLNGSVEEAMKLSEPYPADKMMIVQSGEGKSDRGK